MPKGETVGNIVIDGKGAQRSSTWTITKANKQRRTNNQAKEQIKQQCSEEVRKTRRRGRKEAEATKK